MSITEQETPVESLFDRSQYQRPELRIDKIDGHDIDRPRFKFSGAVSLDRMSPEDVGMFNDARMGEEFEVRVRVRVAGFGVRVVSDRDGDFQATIGERSLTIEGVWTD